MAVIMTHAPGAGYGGAVTSDRDRTSDSEWAGEWGTTAGRPAGPVAFGEQGARLTYGSYLRLEQLLSAQRLESDPPAHDELLFITIHQVYELWFQQLLHEATAARDAILADGATAAGGADGTDRLWLAQHLLQRMHVVERVLVQQVDVLETMTPQDFLQFRQTLAPASGFQSVQFRELESSRGPRTPPSSSASAGSPTKSGSGCVAASTSRPSGTPS